LFFSIYKYIHLLPSNVNYTALAITMVVESITGSLSHTSNTCMVSFVMMLEEDFEDLVHEVKRGL